MASVIRIKRKRNEEPAQAIIISWKRFKSDETGKGTSQNVLTHVGTLKSNDSVNQLKDVIKQSKSEPHTPSKHKIDDILSKAQLTNEDTSPNKRFKLISTRQPQLLSEDNVGSAAVSEVEESNTDLEAIKLYDAIEANEKMAPVVQSNDTITVNGQPMVRQKVRHESSDDDEVYDLYYSGQNDFDDRNFEHCVSIYPFSNDEMFQEEYRDNGNDYFGDDDDSEDSNDENNWKNDYPDEDEDELCDKSYQDDDELVGLTKNFALDDDKPSSDDGCDYSSEDEGGFKFRSGSESD